MSEVNTIYALADPRDGVRYFVGRTINDPPENRIKHHLRRPESEKLRAWFDELNHAGLEPSLDVLEQISEEEDWRAAEVYWIRKGMAEDWPLLGSHTGGDDYPLDSIYEAEPDDPVSREIYGDKAVFIPLVQLNVHVCKGRSPDTSIFMSLLHDAFELLHVFKTNTASFAALEHSIMEKLLDEGIIQKGRIWRVEVLGQSNAIGGERLKVQRPYRMHGINTPGNWDGIEGYHTKIHMWKKTSDLLDQLATIPIEGRRAGFGSTLGASLSLLGSICDEAAGDDAVGVG